MKKTASSLNLNVSEQQYLKFAKLFLVSLVILLTISSGKMHHWPFIYWELYDQGNPQIPKTISRIELRVLDTNGNSYSVRIMDLYTLDDDSSKQTGGLNIIKKTFLKQPQNWDVYRPYLIKHLEKKLNIQVEQIEAYRYRWQLNYNIYPPLNIESPSQVTKIDSFKASDYRN
ncbi:MAG: hypothetical protein AAGF26_13925 [Cyanobacteria bacterium P01_G01_bin.49]